MPRRGPSVLGRLLRGALLLALALAAVTAVAIAFFPFDRLAPALGAWVEHETGIATHFDALDVGFGLRGPELGARGVTLRWPTGEEVALEALSVRASRPAAWLRGVPTAFVTADAAFGSFEGVASRERVTGDFTDFDFAQLPRVWFGEGGSPLAGAVDAHVDLTRLADQWSGAVQLSGGEGSLALPGAPIAIPYERLDADASLDELGTLHLKSLALAGPMVSAHAQGEVQAGYAGPASGAIAIEATLERLDPTLQPALAPYGVTLGPGGAGRLTISGTPDQIVVR